MNAAATRSPRTRNVPSGTEYHQALAGPRRRIARGLLAIGLLVAGMAVSALLLSAAAMWLEGIVRPDAVSDEPMNSPFVAGAGLIAVALLVPWSIAIQRWLYGVGRGSMHSVLGRFRFDLFGRALVMIVPLFAIALSVQEFTSPADSVTWARGDLLAMFLMTVLLVPLQAAGEEYGFRGLILRVAGSWVRGRIPALVLGIGVSALAFAMLHAAPDPGWNLFYLVVSVATGLVTWRTGGLEIAVLIHASFNVFYFSFGLVPQADLAERFDRSAGAMTPSLFIPATLALALVTAVVWLRTRRTGPVTAPTT
ncbi:CPBP family intramembrane glutamic endopeptidase [Brachybacterium atlanticum]|uniref:CPBP family intramembrane glutamic endopeptidase n=1 Tax=Brachybacterium atlanticum TaxID=2911888 RepID=UPI0021E0CC73|nr:CPBP family glutamic-type intramembrane protease [Brachybacterium atlanticum]